MNHCFDDVEHFMSRLQQAAEAERVLSQKTKKRSKKSSKKWDPDGESPASEPNPQNAERQRRSRSSPGASSEDEPGP